jgi:4-hydroxy 2-oxovalerate aldolase
MKKIELLDCTLRDGGYYNNWFFSNKLIKEYFKIISKYKIGYVEIGFRSLDKITFKGETAYSSDKFIKKINVPKNIKLGTMINASEIINKIDTPEFLIKKLFPKKERISFIRIACHHDEIFKIDKAIRWLKNKKYIIHLNIMQISEINTKLIKKICIYAKKNNIDVIYFADSFGSLKKVKLLKIIRKFKTYWKKEMGLHAHNNMSLALKNSIIANKNGVKWIDSTMSGMGRGAGNLRTEQMLRQLNYGNFKFIDKFIKIYFTPMKQVYKWGPNKYYEFAAKHKIHPTYIQKILSDRRYKKIGYKKLLKKLSKNYSKKYDPFNLINSLNFYKKKITGETLSKNLFINKKILILGSGESLKKNKYKINKLILNKKLFTISLNNNDHINKNLIKLRVFVHPLRILTFLTKNNIHKSNIILPYSMLQNNIKKIVKLKKDKIIDYGVRIGKKDTILIKNNHCIIPSFLSISYILAILTNTKIRKIYLAGFDVIKKNDTSNDETINILKYFNKKYNFKFEKLI